MRPIAYTRQQAAELCGLSPDSIKKAIAAGDLATLTPKVNGTKIGRDLIEHDELMRWLRDEPRTA
jgi:hypothetical protein